MLRIDATRRDIELTAYKRRSAQEADCARLVAEPCQVYQDDRLVVAYLELAGDAGAALVVHRKWLRSDDEMRDGVNCLAASDGPSLAATLQHEPPTPITEGGRLSLQAHAPAAVAPRYVALFGRARLGAA